VKNKPVHALSVVVVDLKSAAEHYQTWRADGREHVLSKYDEIVSSIGVGPDSFPRKFGMVQRAILKQSYYVVYFMQEPDHSLVLAVLDGRRNPDEITKIIRVRATPRGRD
jgi:plasmid stabilization system protein ParE